MKTIFRLVVLFGFILAIPGIRSFSQVGINTDNSEPNNSAMLDVKSTEKGFLPPRMTLLQRNAIPSPAAGLIVYCTDCNDDGSGVISIYLGDKWKNIMIDCIPSAPIEGTHIPSSCQIEWHWNAASGATGYRASGTNDYATAGDMGNVTTGTQPDLAPNTTFSVYVWAYNACGHSAATTLTSTTLTGFSIGQSCYGGIIFYVNGSGDHGLIAATGDQNTGTQWGCVGTHIVGTGTSIGTGQDNTTAIVNGCGESGIAARVCNDFVYSSGNTEYNDWFLPSKDELNQMYLQKTVIGGFAGSFYWSSSESSADNAWLQNFGTGTQSAVSKSSGTTKVRAVRAF
jgi:Protein of unknown function (DUF1566)